ncbi:hypothetical protein ACFLS1_09665 [Verrucomicrobiota bacterium]
MSCIVGITTDTGKTKAEHEKTFQGIHSWQIMQSDTTKEQAESWAKMFSSYHACNKYLNGHGPNGSGNWHAYHFHYDNEK